MADDVNAAFEALLRCFENGIAMGVENLYDEVYRGVLESSLGSLGPTPVEASRIVCDYAFLPNGDAKTLVEQTIQKYGGETLTWHKCVSVMLTKNLCVPPKCTKWYLVEFGTDRVFIPVPKNTETFECWRAKQEWINQDVFRDGDSLSPFMQDVKRFYYASAFNNLCLMGLTHRRFLENLECSDKQGQSKCIPFLDVYHPEQGQQQSIRELYGIENRRGWRYGYTGFYDIPVDIFNLHIPKEFVRLNERRIKYTRKFKAECALDEEDRKRDRLMQAHACEIHRKERFSEDKVFVPFEELFDETVQEVIVCPVVVNERRLKKYEVPRHYKTITDCFVFNVSLMTAEDGSQQYNAQELHLGTLAAHIKGHTPVDVQKATEDTFAWQNAKKPKLDGNANITYIIDNLKSTKAETNAGPIPQVSLRTRSYTHGNRRVRIYPTIQWHQAQKEQVYFEKRRVNFSCWGRCGASARTQMPERTHEENIQAWKHHHASDGPHERIVMVYPLLDRLAEKDEDKCCFTRQSMTAVNLIPQLGNAFQELHNFVYIDKAKEASGSDSLVAMIYETGNYISKPKECMCSWRPGIYQPHRVDIGNVPLEMMHSRNRQGSTCTAKCCSELLRLGNSTDFPLSLKLIDGELVVDKSPKQCCVERCGVADTAMVVIRFDGQTIGPCEQPGRKKLKRELNYWLCSSCFEAGTPFPNEGGYTLDSRNRLRYPDILEGTTCILTGGKAVIVEKQVQRAPDAFLRRGFDGNFYVDGVYAPLRPPPFNMDVFDASLFEKQYTPNFTWNHATSVLKRIACNCPPARKTFTCCETAIACLFCDEVNDGFRKLTFHEISKQFKKDHKIKKLHRSLVEKGLIDGNSKLSTREIEKMGKRADVDVNDAKLKEKESASLAAMYNCLGKQECENFLRFFSFRLANADKPFNWSERVSAVLKVCTVFDTRMKLAIDANIMASTFSRTIDKVCDYGLRYKC